VTRRFLAVAVVVAVVAAALATAGLVAPTATAAPDGVMRFADVDPDRFDGPAIDWAQAGGVVTGVSERCFVPDRHATRAEVAAVLQRLVAPDATSTAHPFDDVVAAWQQVPVAWMHATGATTGTSATTYAPDGITTRGMVAAFLHRLEGRPPAAGPADPFTDVVADWQRDAVRWMWAEGITTGRSATRFAPDAPVTRGELLTFVWRWQGSPAPSVPVRAATDAGGVDCLVAAGICADVFAPLDVFAIDRAAAGRNVTAHVHDHRTGCVYELRADTPITTASVIKAQILAGVLFHAQDRGVPVSAADRDRIDLMMRFSHNAPPTSALYAAVGGAAGMEALDGRFGLTATAHTSTYGATVSTARDRTRLVEQLLIGGGPLGAEAVAAAWETMSTVTSTQQWGLSAGLPEGHDVALKNGFFPLSGRGWRVGTSGVVATPDGGTYAATILTDGNPDEASGITLVEQVAEHVNAMLTAGPAAPRPGDALACRTVSGSATWDALGATLDTHPATLRHHNGGEAAPLRGQRVCAP